jgi:hypothetical protein
MLGKMDGIQRTEFKNEVQCTLVLSSKWKFVASEDLVNTHVSPVGIKRYTCTLLTTSAYWIGVAFQKELQKVRIGIFDWRQILANSV